MKRLIIDANGSDFTITKTDSTALTSAITKFMPLEAKSITDTFLGIPTVVLSPTGNTSSLWTNSNPFGLTPIYVEGSPLSKFDTSNVLNIVFPAGKYGPATTGYNFQAKLTSTATKTLSYDVKFASDYDFVKGGKLPGLAGGVGVSGGNPANGTNGYSARMMWRTGGRLVSYVYHVNQASQYGDDFTWNTVISKAVWHNIKMTISLNTVGQSNGIIKGFFDGVEVFSKSDFKFRTIEALKVDLLYFNTFFGGDDNTWAPTKDEKLAIRNLIIN